MSAVVIERYDRAPEAPEGRIHQEDFNQALGAAGSQKYQPNDGEVALAVAGEYRHAAITLEDLVREGTSWGLNGAAALAEETLTATLEQARAEVPDERAHAGLAEDIARFTSNLLAGRAAGERPAS